MLCIFFPKPHVHVDRSIFLVATQRSTTHILPLSLSAPPLRPPSSLTTPSPSSTPTANWTPQLPSQYQVRPPTSTGHTLPSTQPTSSSLAASTTTSTPPPTPTRAQQHQSFQLPASHPRPPSQSQPFNPHLRCVPSRAQLQYLLAPPPGIGPPHHKRSTEPTCDVDGGLVNVPTPEHHRNHTASIPPPQSWCSRTPPS